MEKKYIEKNIDRLRKQRDENIIGGYRDLVVKTYNYIERKIKKSGVDYCNPKNNDISNAVFENKNEGARIRGFVNDLKKSGYISVENSG